MNAIKLPSDRQLRILITRADRIGDLVLSTPVFEAMREKFPKAWISCLIFCENREIVEGNPFLDQIILYDKKGSEKTWLGNWFFSRCLAKEKFDLVVHLHATNRMHVVTWLAGIPVRIGYSRKSAWALTHVVPDNKKEGLQHETEYHFELLKCLNVPKPAFPKTYYPLTEKSWKSFEELLRQYPVPEGLPWVVLNPLASCSSKLWPVERFVQLAKRIYEKYQAVFILAGTRQERVLINKMTETPNVPFYDFSGKLTLGMLGVLLSKSTLVISNDSGPIHIADAVGTPVISIFGRNQAGLGPKRWAPRHPRSRVVSKDVGCVECLAHNCQIHFLCLDAISVEDVFREVEQFSDLLNVRNGAAV